MKKFFNVYVGIVFIIILSACNNNTGEETLEAGARKM